MDVSLIACTNKRAPINKSCGVSGSEKIITAIEKEIDKRGLKVKVERVGCLGECERGPNMRIAPGGKFFRQVTLESVDEICLALENFISSNP